MPLDARRALAVFAVLLTGYLVCPIKTCFDSQLVIPTAISILREGNVNLDEYAPTFERFHHGVDELRGHIYNSFPLGPALVAVPFMAVADAGMRIAAVFKPHAKVVARWRKHFDGTGNIQLDFWDTAELIIASICTALSGALVFMTARLALPLQRAWTVALVFGFGTSALSTASRGLWQHGPSMACLAATVYLLARARTDSRWAAWAGTTVALSYVMRPTNSLSVLGWTAFVAIAHRRELVKFLGTGAAILVPWMMLNEALFGAALPPYYQAGRLSFEHAPEALAGNLLSPARGLFIFTPVALLVIVTTVHRLVSRRLSLLEGVAALIVVVHWLVISSFPHWWAGHSYGPRFFTDMMPYVAFLMVPVVTDLGRSAPMRTAAFAILAAAGIAIHLRGATTWRVYAWNDKPINVDDAPTRIWDWTDLQMLR